MRKMLDKLHARLGDFWWYSLMLFCACRAADLLNAFVGLWLVPKYVDPAELGALMPLMNFANFLALPVTAFAVTFRNEVSRLTIGRDFGKLKTLIRGVFIATAIFLFIAILVSRSLLPLFLERIRMVEGALGFIIIAVAFLSAIAPIYTNALQALKKFREQSILNIVSAPIRLATMLITMPFRAITGYFAGQASAPAFMIVGSIFFLRKELSVKAEPYWCRDTVLRFAKLFTIILISGAAGGFCLLVESTVLRQRLPNLDSAGYYMATRFSDISTFLYCTLVFTIFPFTADMAAKGKDMRPLFIKAAAATIGFSTLVALPFMFFGKSILEFLPNGDQYAAYWWTIPWQIGISALISLIGLYTTVEVSANHFRFVMWMAPLDIIYPTLLFLVTGHGYFTGLIPESWTTFLSTHNIRSLDSMLCWMTGFYSIKVFCCLLAMTKPSNGKRPGVICATVIKQ